MAQIAPQEKNVNNSFKCLNQPKKLNAQRGKMSYGFHTFFDQWGPLFAEPLFGQTCLNPPLALSANNHTEIQLLMATACLFSK